MFKNILIAYDGSEHARKAAILAGNVARDQKLSTAVWIVTVMDRPSQDLGEPNMSRFVAERTDTGDTLIAEAVTLVGAELQIHKELLFGAPAESILSVAETRGCDLIVMGARGLNPLEMLLMGSQTQKVISQARCPVMVTK